MLLRTRFVLIVLTCVTVLGVKGKLVGDPPYCYNQNMVVVNPTQIMGRCDGYTYCVPFYTCGNVGTSCSDTHTLWPYVKTLQAWSIGICDSTSYTHRCTICPAGALFGCAELRAYLAISATGLCEGPCSTKTYVFSSSGGACKS